MEEGKKETGLKLQNGTGTEKKKRDTKRREEEGSRNQNSTTFNKSSPKEGDVGEAVEKVDRSWPVKCQKEK